MKRRDFIKSAFALSAFGTQIPVMALGRKNQFGRIVQWDTDRILSSLNSTEVTMD